MDYIEGVITEVLPTNPILGWDRWASEPKQTIRFERINPGQGEGYSVKVFKCNHMPNLKQAAEWGMWQFPRMYDLNTGDRFRLESTQKAKRIAKNS